MSRIHIVFAIVCWFAFNILIYPHILKYRRRDHYCKLLVRLSHMAPIKTSLAYIILLYLFCFFVFFLHFWLPIYLLHVSSIFNVHCPIAIRAILSFAQDILATKNFCHFGSIKFIFFALYFCYCCCWFGKAVCIFGKKQITVIDH